MKIAVLAAGLGFAALAAAALPAAAAPAACGQIVAGQGRHSRVEGSSDWKRHNGRVPPRLAHDRAIADWQAKVKAQCPGSSTIWLRASNRKVECEGKMGGEVCKATAKPAGKLFGRRR